MPSLGRRIAIGVAGWLATIGGVALAVHPERCGSPRGAEMRASAELAVEWFAANLDPDGRFVYRWDRERAMREPGYNDVRHAGVLWSLYQAERAGITGAADIADRGLAHVDRRLVSTAAGPAFGAGPELPTGASALLAVALDERRLATGTADRDELLLQLGATLVATVTPEGAVAAGIRRDGTVTDTRSPFFTGEILWALARLHLTFPDAGFDEPALRVRRYLVEDRDATEAPWPPVSDHWGAYAFETMSRWPEPPGLTDGERDWLDRQLALFGLQVRYESQRTGGVTRLTRGPQALAAGVGTLGEGLGNHLALIDRLGVATDDLDAVLARARCTAGLLVERQVRSARARPDAEPERAVGAWFRLGDTQMDDQQHALSALLLLEDWATP